MLRDDIVVLCMPECGLKINGHRLLELLDLSIGDGKLRVLTFSLISLHDDFTVQQDIDLDFYKRPNLRLY